MTRVGQLVKRSTNYIDGKGSMTGLNLTNIPLKVSMVRNLKPEGDYLICIARRSKYVRKKAAIKKNEENAKIERANLTGIRSQMYKQGLN